MLTWLVFLACPEAAVGRQDDFETLIGGGQCLCVYRQGRPRVIYECEVAIQGGRAGLQPCQNPARRGAPPFALQHPRDLLVFSIRKSPPADRHTLPF